MSDKKYHCSTCYNSSDHRDGWKESLWTEGVFTCPDCLAFDQEVIDDQNDYDFYD